VIGATEWRYRGRATRWKKLEINADDLPPIAAGNDPYVRRIGRGSALALPFIFAATWLCVFLFAAISN